MIQDRMIEEIQELKLAGYTVREAHDTLRARHNKVPTLKTVRKYYNMDRVPEDGHARVRKQAAFDVGPLASAIVEILERNPGCYMSSVYDVLVERFVETGEMDALPGNEQTLRNYIRRLREEGRVSESEDARRRYDVVDVPEPGRMAQVDFGQQGCGGGLVVHFMCVLPWHSRLLGVYAQDHRFNSEESCRALHRFSCKCGGRVRTYVIDQDSVFVSEEVYGEVFETATFKAFLEEQGITLWVCRKADPESKGAVENSVRFVKSSFFSAREFGTIDDVLRALPAWVERKNRRIHQGTHQVPQQVFERVERAALRPLLPSLWEAAPTDLVEAPVNGQPYVLHRSVKYSVPWDMCYTTAYKRVIGGKLHIYDARRRHVCTHDICEVRGSFMRLDEHRRQPASDWLDTAERMRLKWNCTEFQHFINGFKRENPERNLGRQLSAVERYLDERHPSRALAAESDGRFERKRRRNYASAHFPPGVRPLAEFDPSELESGITASQVEQLASLDWLDAHGNVVLAGPPGLGKTMVALGLGLLAVDEGYTVAFEKMESFIKVLDDAGVDRKAGFRLRYLRKCQLVIVDEIGYTPITRTQANRFFSFVSDAYERSSMVFTTNKEITQWEELVGDRTLTTAMLDRILHHARCFSLRGESYRLKHPELYATDRL